MNSRAASVVAFAALVSVVAYLLYSHSLLAQRPIGIAFQVAAVLLMLWARVTFGRRSFHAAANPTAGGLVTSGPYRYLRHPIYIAILLFILTGVFANWSGRSALSGLVAIAAVLVRMLSEEKLLKLRYPEYVEYSRRAKRFIPFIY